MAGWRLKGLLAALSLGVSWRLILFFDRSFWTTMASGGPAKPETAWLVLCAALYSSIFLGVFLLKGRGVEPYFMASGGASIALIVLMRLFPALQALYILHALFGVSAGLYNAAIFIYAALGIAPESRVKAIGISVTGFSAIVFLWMWAAPSLPFNASLTILAASIAIPPILMRTWGFAPHAQARIGPADPLPLKLLLSTGLIIFAGYFGNYLNQSGFGTQEFMMDEPRMAWLGFAVRMIACAAFIALGKGIKIFRLVYLAQGVMVLSFVVNAANLPTRLPAWVLFNLSNVVGTVLVYALLSAVLGKYFYRLKPLAILALSPGIGIILGYLCGRAAAAALRGNPLLYQALPLTVASLVFFALPFVIRSISQDIDLDRAPTPGFLKGSAIPVGAEAGPTAGKVGGGADTASSPIAEAKQAFSPDPSMGSIPEREVILRRRRIEDSLDELNRSFDEEFKLTAREKEIASYLAERYDYETISDKLLISVNTLKVHVKNIYRKYDLPGRKALVELVESRSEGKSA